jgi:hypothetical protein
MYVHRSLNSPEDVAAHPARVLERDEGVCSGRSSAEWLAAVTVATMSSTSCDTIAPELNSISCGPASPKTTRAAWPGNWRMPVTPSAGEMPTRMSWRKIATELIWLAARAGAEKQRERETGSRGQGDMCTTCKDLISQSLASCAAVPCVGMHNGVERATQPRLGAQHAPLPYNGLSLHWQHAGTWPSSS